MVGTQGGEDYKSKRSKVYEKTIESANPLYLMNALSPFPALFPKRMKAWSAFALAALPRCSSSSPGDRPKRMKASPPARFPKRM